MCLVEESWLTSGKGRLQRRGVQVNRRNSGPAWPRQDWRLAGKTGAPATALGLDEHSGQRAVPE